MKIKNLKLFGLALSGVLSVTQLTGCGNTYASYTEEKGFEYTRQFDRGEHIISVPLENNIGECITQLEYHPGYEVVGITTSIYGRFSPSFAGGVVVYQNVETVECSSNIYDENGEFVYLNFGLPLDYEEEVKISEDVCEFDIGEHIIAVPLEGNVINQNTQYEYHEGYEVVGINLAAYGEFSPSYTGGVIVYKNTMPVIVKI